MRESPRRLPGALFVSGLLALGLGFAGWLRLHHPVAVLKDVGADHSPIPGLGWPDLRIDVNSAEEAQLDLLPGIGPRLAARIVEDRRTQGSFASLDELMRVTGLGPRLVERLRPYAVANVPDVLHTAASPRHQFADRND
ncbi:MAG: helix-hairpin-helix domain-containing protein [Planctomycetes bacterium]|nr:helix-hairpin-helix domain-containing protein [Planctomycetota bacterium]